MPEIPKPFPRPKREAYTDELIDIFVAVPVYIVRPALTDRLITPLNASASLSLLATRKSASRWRLAVRDRRRGRWGARSGLIALADHPS